MIHENSIIQNRMTSAEVLQFPVGGRAGRRALNDTSRPNISDAAMPLNTVLGSGESWYHAEAIQAANTATT